MLYECSSGGKRLYSEKPEGNRNNTTKGSEEQGGGGGRTPSSVSHLHHWTRFFGAEVDSRRREAGSALSEQTGGHQETSVTRAGGGDLLL